jgi:hypothetical protein
VVELSLKRKILITGRSSAIGGRGNGKLQLNSLQKERSLTIMFLTQETVMEA